MLFRSVSQSRYEGIIGSKAHPAEKPVPLMSFYIKNSTNEGDIVLDPFMGSGTTAIACVNTGRNFIGFELDKHYCDIANERIQKAIPTPQGGGGGERCILGEGEHLCSEFEDAMNRLEQALAELDKEGER